MERSTATGRNRGKGEREKGKEMQPRFFHPLSPFPITLLPSTRKRVGFTLLELMIVITIIIILAAIVLPQYQKTILATREAVLRDDLNTMRMLVDQYGADKQKLSQSLDDLVTERYMREVPVDPMTGQKDWMVVTGDDANSISGDQGIIEIRSASGDTSSEGTPYSEW